MVGDPHGDGMGSAHAWIDEAYSAPVAPEQDTTPRFTRYNMVAAYAAGESAARRDIRGADWTPGCPRCVASKFTCDEHFVRGGTHRGWTISFDYPPIPCRNFDWSATHPDYDCDCDSDGFYCVAGAIVHGRTREDVIAEIDAWYDEQVDL